eukprot:Rmarinus@m.25300
MSAEEASLELHETARYGELEDMPQLLELGGDVNFLDGGGSTALHKAAANGHLGCAKFLVEHNAEFLANGNGQTPLHWAILNKRLDLVKYLLEACPDADVVKQYNGSKSALSYAFEANVEDILVEILKHPSAAALENKDEKKQSSGPTYVEHKFKFDPSVDVVEVGPSHMREVAMEGDIFGDDNMQDKTGLAIWAGAVVLSRHLLYAEEESRRQKNKRKKNKRKPQPQTDTSTPETSHAETIKAPTVTTNTTTSSDTAPTTTTSNIGPTTTTTSPDTTTTSASSHATTTDGETTAHTHQSGASGSSARGRDGGGVNENGGSSSVGGGSGSNSVGSGSSSGGGSGSGVNENGGGSGGGIGSSGGNVVDGAAGSDSCAASNMYGSREGKRGDGKCMSAESEAHCFTPQVSLKRYKDRKVLELGAGCGLPGITLAKLSECSRVVLTDIFEENMENMKFNVKKNSLQSKVEVHRLDWHDKSTWLGPGSFDFVIGSDLVYDTELSPPLLDVIVFHLRRGGRFVYVTTDKANNRAGLDEFLAAVDAHEGLCKVEHSTFLAPASYKTNPLLDQSDSLADLHFGELSLEFGVYEYICQ